jgi:hypothetical protein
MKKKEIYKFNQIKIDKKYRGKVVAYYKGKIIASGDTIQEVDKKIGKKKVMYIAVPKHDFLVV